MKSQISTFNIKPHYFEPVNITFKIFQLFVNDFEETANSSIL